MSEGTWQIPVDPPFSLEKTVRAFQRLPVNETQVWHEGAFLRSIRIGERHCALIVTQPEPETLELAVAGSALSDAERHAVSEQVRWMLAVDHDLDPFAQRAARFLRLRAVFDALVGLKPPRFPDLFETLVNTLLFQQISLHAGTALLNRLARSFGATHATPWGEVRRLPTPEEVSALPEEALQGIGFSRHKTRALIALARQITAGALSFEPLAALPTPELEQRLVALPGIGPWSARVVMIRGFGRLDTFPTGDSGASKTLRALFEVHAADVEALQAELLQGLAPYQGFLYFCLLGWRLMRAGVLEGNGCDWTGK
jgi:DNA-3-methyladenine glycosylase II